MFPGLYCPGLIEAGVGSVYWSDIAAWFPGLYCPGLIEANPGEDEGHSKEPGFRGSIAPASLKRAACGGARRRCPWFPGLYCPGLIEAARPCTATACRRPFPGLYCPGLIEAT